MRAEDLRVFLFRTTNSAHAQSRPLEWQCARAVGALVGARKHRAPEHKRATLASAVAAFAAAAAARPTHSSGLIIDCLSASLAATLALASDAAT